MKSEPGSPTVGGTLKKRHDLEGALEGAAAFWSAAVLRRFGSRVVAPYRRPANVTGGFVRAKGKRRSSGALQTWRMLGRPFAYSNNCGARARSEQHSSASSEGLAGTMTP